MQHRVAVSSSNNLAPLKSLCKPEVATKLLEVSGHFHNGGWTAVMRSAHPNWFWARNDLTFTMASCSWKTNYLFWTTALASW
jgi:hypothetical protein